MAQKWKAFAIIGAVVLGLIGTGYVLRENIGAALFSRAVEQGIKVNRFAQLDDGLHVILCGSGSPLPDITRSGPCTIIVAGDQKFLIDAGSGAGRQFGLMQLPIGELDAIFLTHFHSDHIDGLGETLLLRWASVGNSEPLPVYGAQGLKQVLDGLAAAYALDTGYRVSHHGERAVPPAGAGAKAMPFSIGEDRETAQIYNQNGIQVTAIRVPHSPADPAMGYRFDYKGRSVVVSGDTIQSPNLARACNGCDILVHEALNPEMVKIMYTAAVEAGNPSLAKIMTDIPSYHASPVEAAQSAKKGKASMLVITHIIPPLPSPVLYPFFLKGTAEQYDGPIIVGEDGMVFSLPAGKSGIERDSLL